MVAAVVIAGRSPWQVVPARYRPGADVPAAPPRPLTAEERTIAEAVGLANLGRALKRHQ